MDNLKIKDWPDLPEDNETQILFRNSVSIIGLSAIHEKWSWDGLHGESAILRNQEVESFNDETLRNAIINELDVLDCESMTVSRGDKYTFVNFNFRH